MYQYFRYRSHSIHVPVYNIQGYKFSGVIDPVTGKKDIVCKNKRQNCGASQCQCDRQLAFQLAEAEIAWNPNNQGSIRN